MVKIWSTGLNTLTGGHPLGGSCSSAVLDESRDVSIPSQAGILLAGLPPPPSQDGWVGLNTLTGGHPLGGEGALSVVSDLHVSIPSQAGILLAVGKQFLTVSREAFCQITQEV